MTKPLLILTGITTLLLFACTNPSHGPKGIVDIKNMPAESGTEMNLGTHKPYDVEVYKTYLTSPGYEVTYYQKENDTLVYHGADYGDTSNYDKAAYEWKNDTTVAIRLYNTVTNKEAKFQVFGKGATNGMIMDDK